MRRTLEELGYGGFFEEGRQASGLGECGVARVAAEYKGLYKVIGEDAEGLAEVAGRLVYAAARREDYPAVGDWVAVTWTGGEAVIQAILPRRTLIRRKRAGRQEAQVIAANIDTAFIVESVDRDFNLNRLERYLAIAGDVGVDPVVVLNKIDLVGEAERAALKARIESRFEGGEIFAVSAASSEGLEELTARIAGGGTCCFMGSSGVGKSSIINRLLGEEVIRTETISESTGKGRHTTTTREMYFMDGGGILIDNPGMREVGMADTAGGIEGVFEEVEALAANCAFRDCSHEHEPGCAVREAVDSGELDPERFDNYLKLRREAEFFEMTDLEKRRKDRDFGKFIKDYKKQSGRLKE